MIRWLLSVPTRLLHLLQDTTGVRPIDTAELRELQRLQRQLDGRDQR
jgi:hypothetical protein